MRLLLIKTLKSTKVRLPKPQLRSSLMVNFENHLNFLKKVKTPQLVFNGSVISKLTTNFLNLY